MQYGNNPIEIGRLQPTAYSLLLDRGYTSHEHLFEVGLIHMNGRLYDPLLRRFLNADEHIQDPYNTQNYNKYGYVYNNPLMYNDPSGEFFVFMGLGVLFWKAVIIGAAIGVASYTVGLAVTGNLHQWSLGGVLKSAFWGAVSGAMTFGIGNLFSVAKDGVQVATQFAKNLGELGTAFVQSGLHAVGQGVLSVMQGGSFEQAFWSGALGSLGASAFGAIAGDFASSAGGTIAFGALSGGIGAELSGGNFWEGAVIGGIVAGLNHVAHRVDNDHEWMLTKDGKTVKVGNKGGDQIDYLYDEHYGPVLDRPLLAVAEVEHSTITTGKFSSGGHSTESGFGYRIHRKFGGHALQDPSFDIMSNIPLSGGAALTKMGLTKVLKSDYGVRVVLGGSKTMLRSSYFFTNQLGLNYKMGVRLPTLYKSTNNLGQFLGRNSAFFGVVSMRYGANRYVNQRK